VVVIHAKSTDTKLLALLNRLATHPVTRKLSVLWVNEDNTVVEGLQSLTPNLKILKHPMDWEDMLGELEKLLPMFGRQWDDPLTRIPSPAPKTSVPDHPTTTPESRHMVAAVEPKTLTVLCIDDDPVVARSIAIRLQPYGIKVREADDGTQGYLMATAEQPDLIVLDLKMPHGEGNFVIGKLKDNPRTKNIPVIILTVETSASARRQMLSLGADAFLTKPMQWPELFAEMGRCVQLPKQLLADYHLPEQLTIQQL
jgi:CheY-like chemotaxis protein